MIDKELIIRLKKELDTLDIDILKYFANPSDAISFKPLKNLKIPMQPLRLCENYIRQDYKSCTYDVLKAKVSILIEKRLMNEWSFDANMSMDGVLASRITKLGITLIESL